MNSNTLLDALKKRLNLPSDNALAVQHFRVTPKAVKEMRERGLSDERALHVAAQLELNPGEVLAAIHAERAKNKEVKAAWDSVARALKKASAATVTGAFVLAASPALHSGSMYIMSNRKKRAPWPLRMAQNKRSRVRGTFPRQTQMKFPRSGIGFARPSPI